MSTTTANTNCATRMPTAIKYQLRTVICLAFIAGFTDAYGFLNFKTYVSFMSGNTTQTGYGLAQFNFQGIKLALMAIFSFSTGIFSGTYVSAYQWYKKLWTPYVIVSLLLLLYMFTIIFFKNIYYSIIYLSFTMGFLNTALNTIGKQSVNPDFVTGTLNSLAKHLAYWANKLPLSDVQGAWDTHKSRALQLLYVWFAFLTGAFMATVSQPLLGLYTLLVPALMLLVIAYAYSFAVKNTTE